MSEKVKNIIGKIVNVILVIFLIFAVLITILAFSTINNKDGVPAIGGITLLTVQSDSMAPTFKKGDLILGKKIKTAEDAKSFKKDDVITFFADLDGDGADELNSHRIVTATDASDLVIYQTKGDNNQLEDSYQVYSTEVKCKWTGVKLIGLGAFIDFLKTSTGFLLCIVLPLALFFIYELIRFVVMVMKLKNEGKETVVNAGVAAIDEEEIKRKAVEEYIRQQEAEKQAENTETKQDN